MKEKLTEMVFIMDRSGSMSGLEKDTIGGFNSMIDKQKRLEGKALVSTVLFNHETQILHNQIDIKEISKMTENDYLASGATALLDAVGNSIRHIRRVYAETLKEERPEKVLFIITTDGMENSSREYSYKDVKALIEEAKENYSWEFIFLGANIDAIDEASKLGINKDRTSFYHADKKGTKVHYDAINEAVTSMRMTNEIKVDWKKKIEDDDQTRNLKK